MSPLQSGGSLHLFNLSRLDSALYICLVSTKSAEAKKIDNKKARLFENVDGTFIESMEVRLIVRSVPCAVTRLTMRISTILGVLIWEYNRNTTYSHPLKSFTAEFRRYNSTWPAPWERLDPINISPNVVSSCSSVFFLKDSKIYPELFGRAEISRNLPLAAKHYLRVSDLGKQLYRTRRNSVYNSKNVA